MKSERVQERMEREFGKLLFGTEVAEMFGVHPNTVMRWADEGILTDIRTPGGHRRYRESEVLGLLRAQQPGS